jgi:hypothetical protein
MQELREACGSACTIFRTDGPGAVQRRLDPGGDAPDAARGICAAHRRALGRAALRPRLMPRLQLAAGDRHRGIDLQRCPPGGARRRLGRPGDLMVA